MEVRHALQARLAGLVSLRRQGVPATGQANLVFAGAEANGRDAVAVLYARTLAELGLPTGAVHRAQLSALPARGPGQAEANVSALFDDAVGGVLVLELDQFLAARPVRETTALVTAVRETIARQPDVVLVLSGEPQPLADLLGAEPGSRLAGCFADRLDFAPYSPEQPARLAVRRLTAAGLEAADGVAEALAAHFGRIPPRSQSFGAHWCADQLADAAASRVVRVADLPTLLWALDADPAEAAAVA